MAINGFAHEYEEKDKAKLTHKVRSIVDELKDWEQLEKDMIEIDYPYDFKGGSQNQKKSKWKFW